MTHDEITPQNVCRYGNYDRYRSWKQKNEQNIEIHIKYRIDRCRLT